MVKLLKEIASLEYAIVCARRRKQYRRLAMLQDRLRPLRTRQIKYEVREEMRRAA